MIVLWLCIVQFSTDTGNTKHLLALDGAEERLHLFKANLLEEGSFDSIVDGCDGVFHTASPVSLSVNDPQVNYSLAIMDVLYSICVNMILKIKLIPGFCLHFRPI